MLCALVLYMSEGTYSTNVPQGKNIFGFLHTKDTTTNNVR